MDLSGILLLGSYQSPHNPVRAFLLVILATGWIGRTARSIASYSNFRWELTGRYWQWVSATDWHDIYGSITKCQVACVLGRIGKPPAGRLDGMARGFCVSRRLLHHRHRAVCVQQKDAHSATDGVATFNFRRQQGET